MASDPAAPGRRAGPLRLLVLRPTMGEGGADRVTLTLLERLDRARFAPTLVLMRAEGPWLGAVPPDVPVRNLGGGRLFTAWRPLARLLRREPPDVLLSTSGGANLAAALAHRVAGSRARLVLSERSSLERADRPAWKGAALLAGKRLLYRRADAVTAVSDGLRRELIARLRLDPARVVRIDNPLVGPDLPALAAEPVEHPWFADGGPVVLAAGRLVEAKDFATLLAALARLRRSHPARLVILGDGPLRERLARRAAELGVADAVDLAGFDPNPFRFMARCTAFVLSSRWEGMPGALIQAMACGAPAVATDCPTGPRELIADGESGLLVPVADPEALAAALGRLLDDPGLRSTLAERGRAAVERFTVERAVATYAAVLEGARSTDTEAVRPRSSAPVGPRGSSGDSGLRTPWEGDG